MSFLVSEVVTLANSFANTASGNNLSLQVPYAAQVLRNYQRDLRSQDKTLDLTTVSTPALTTGVSSYVFTTIDAPDQIDRVAYRLTATSNWIDLLPGSLEDSMDFDQQSGQPAYYFFSRPDGVTTFNVYPKPSSTYAVAGATLRVKCQAKQTDPTLLTDVIYLDKTALSALAYELAALFCLLDNNERKAALLMGLAANERNANAEDMLKTYGILNNELNPLIVGGIGRRRPWIP